MPWSSWSPQIVQPNPRLDDPLRGDDAGPIGRREAPWVLLGVDRQQRQRVTLGCARPRDVDGSSRHGGVEPPGEASQFTARCVVPTAPRRHGGTRHRHEGSERQPGPPTPPRSRPSAGAERGAVAARSEASAADRQRSPCGAGQSPSSHPAAAASGSFRGHETTGGSRMALIDTAFDTVKDALADVTEVASDSLETSTRHSANSPTTGAAARASSSCSSSSCWPCSASWPGRSRRRRPSPPERLRPAARSAARTRGERHGARSTSPSSPSAVPD